MQDIIKVNPLLDRIKMPGETFTLPSGGLMYEAGVLDSSVTDGEIHVHPMTVIDEIAIKSPDLLFSGEAVRQVFARCIPQVLHPNKMFARDVDFLLVCLRKVSYGAEMRLQYIHDCDDKKHEYSVDVDQFIKGSRKLDPMGIKGTYELKMPNGQKVTMRPIRFGDFILMMQITDMKTEDIEEVKRLTLRSVQGVISKVDEIEDPESIYEWLAAVPPGYLTKINDNIDNTLAWGPDFKTTTTCFSCKEKIEIVAPLNPLSFFT